MATLQKFVLVVSIVFLIISCSTNVEPIVKEDKPYITINIGDIRQYYDNKNIYAQIEVIDTLKRTDGKKVFAFEESYLFSDGIFKGINYYFIDDGFFKQTELDTVKIPSINYQNPFNEQKLAKLYPENETCFLRNKNDADKEKVYFHIELIDSLKTKYKVFKNVAKYDVISHSTNSISASYYALGYGHIGSTFITENDTANLFVTYIKVNTKEVGKYNNVFKTTVQESKNLKKSLIKGEIL